MDIQWPKRLNQSTKEEELIRDKFMKIWHEVLPQKYPVVEKFNQKYPLKSKRGKDEKVLDIGAGIGAHLHYEYQDWRKYICVELRNEMAEIIKNKFSHVEVIVGDCQKRLPLEDNYFDRVLAINVLEHLPNLPGALFQIWRVLKPSGLFSVCIPCEGGSVYGLARKLSAKRVFNKYFPGIDYDRIFIANEHINKPPEIINELRKYFKIINREYFPFFIPSINLNLFIGITLTPKNKKVS